MDYKIIILLLLMLFMIFMVYRELYNLKLNLPDIVHSVTDSKLTDIADQIQTNMNRCVKNIKDISSDNFDQLRKIMVLNKQPIKKITACHFTETDDSEFKHNKCRLLQGSDTENNVAKHNNKKNVFQQQLTNKNNDYYYSDGSYTTEDDISEDTSKLSSKRQITNHPKITRNFEEPRAQKINMKNTELIEQIEDYMNTEEKCTNDESMDNDHQLHFDNKITSITDSNMYEKKLTPEQVGGIFGIQINNSTDVLHVLTKQNKVPYFGYPPMKHIKNDPPYLNMIDKRRTISNVNNIVHIKENQFDNQNDQYSNNENSNQLPQKEDECQEIQIIIDDPLMPLNRSSSILDSVVSAQNNQTKNKDEIKEDHENPENCSNNIEDEISQIDMSGTLQNIISPSANNNRKDLPQNNIDDSTSSNEKKSSHNTSQKSIDRKEISDEDDDNDEDYSGLYIQVNKNKSLYTRKASNLKLENISNDTNSTEYTTSDATNIIEHSNDSSSDDDTNTYEWIEEETCSDESGIKVPKAIIRMTRINLKKTANSVNNDDSDDSDSDNSEKFGSIDRYSVDDLRKIAKKNSLTITHAINNNKSRRLYNKSELYDIIKNYFGGK